ncbi:MAG: hypothetical protein PG977_001078 [Bartonella clarridgeiae]|nr:MAG: hypothetical protein PG977_001078 [Bartonella clarridgeiae]
MNLEHSNFKYTEYEIISIVNFVNKMHREALDPLEIVDEIEEKLALDNAPITWPTI